ncbi:succinyl-diaminopimelate desuccinylase [Roseovarius pacificus]|uniref:Succinyl-diaminopimelate desuccinylase n=1 Tax=Roseovarius pacificus TaxID=337701 RepID=A0A1M7AII3_9RHOB|nr:M20/M25/M40 family metallo-hydrolase [Roseovarius pacificus]GGO53399.1 peptidase [Roseovarius pacificus]SHL42603.1 succinyl-diaminopimelate desuccinylase [Roseovarius pacificus]
MTAKHEKGREKILTWLDEEREDIVGLLKAFLRAPSPNPPGNTLVAARVVRDYLDSCGLEHRVIDPHPEMPNIVASFDGESPGRHLVLNGHIDVFPVPDDRHGWTHDPWGGEEADGRIYGRGACDMKPGTTASIITYCLLHRLQADLCGRLTLTCVSDEETFGPWGARYLMEHHPEVHGDCLLNGEPGGPESIRFGERGPLWVEFTVRAKGAHGAYVHATESATKIAMAVARDLEELTELEGELPHNVASAVDAGRPVMDRMMGAGAGDLVSRVTLNIGLIEGGEKANMIPSECRFTADLRLPVGMDKSDLLPRLAEIAERYPGVEWQEVGGDAPSWCDPHHEMVAILQRNVEAFGRPKPTPIVSLGGTDARLWRHNGVPAYVYGPYPHGMGSHDEHVDIEEFLHVVRTHVLSAWDYLSIETRE